MSLPCFTLPTYRWGPPTSPSLSFDTLLKQVRGHKWWLNLLCWATPKSITKSADVHPGHVYRVPSATSVTKDLGVCCPTNTGITIPIKNTFKHHSVEILWLFYHVHLTGLLIQLQFLFSPEDGVGVISSLKAAWLEAKVLLSPRFPWSSELCRKLLFLPALRNSQRSGGLGIRNQSQRFKN